MVRYSYKLCAAIICRHAVRNIFITNPPMSKFMTRSTAIVAALLAVAFAMAPTTASAATGPWIWTDVSNQISVRADRPIWAMARVGTNWIYTDGQDLSVGGHVWQTDGKTSTDITSAIHTAGLAHVDDIVSDGTTAFLMQSPGSSINSMQIVSFTAATIANVSQSFDTSLRPDEGISTLVSQKGTWYIVTTRGRVLAWDGANQAKQITLPNNLQTLVNASKAYSDGTATYVSETNGTQSPGGLPMYLASTGGGLLVSFNTSNGVVYEQYDGAKFSDVTSRFPAVTSVDNVVSNGNSALLIATSHGATTSYETAITYDGSTAQSVILNVNVESNYLPKMVWTGKSWMILSGKNLYRIINNQFESYGQTRDYFTTLSSDWNGSVMLGGAVSAANLTNAPTSPLLAKLVSVYETADSSIASNNGTTYWSWFDPSLTSIGAGQSTNWNIGSWSPVGVQKVDIFVNWVLIKTCDSSLTPRGNQACSVNLNGGAYAPNSNISLIAKITDLNGHATWTPFSQLSVTQNAGSISNASNNSTTQTITSNGVSVWSWFAPNISSMNTSGYVQFSAQGTAVTGLNRLDIIVNDKPATFCLFARSMGTQECDLQLNGLSYPLGSEVQVYAKATDANGQVSTSPVRTIDMRNNLANAGPNPSVVTTWVSPDETILKDGSTHTFYAQAQDTDGLKQVDILMGDNVVQTCNYSAAYGTHECSYAIDPRQFPDDQTENISVRVTDDKGNITWSDTRSYALWHL